MKCKSCGQDTRKGNFCEHCGAKREKARPLKMIKKFIGERKLAVAILIVLVLATVGYLTTGYLTSPQRIVEKYLDTLKEGNYSAAYELVKPSKEKTLDKRAYIAWQKNEKKKQGAVREFVISRDNVLFDGEATINFKLRRNKNEFSESSLKVVKSGSYLGIFPKWQINLLRDTRSFNLLYHGVSLFLDGFDTGIKSGLGKVNIQVYQGNHTIIFKAENAMDHLLKSNYQAVTVEMKPTDLIAKEINQDAQKYYDLVLKAYNTGDMSNLSAYFGPKQLTQLNSDFNEKRRNKMVLYKVNKPVDTSKAELVAPNKVVVFMKFPFDGEMIDFTTQKPKRYYFVLGISWVTYTLKDGCWSMEISNQH